MLIGETGLVQMFDAALVLGTGTGCWCEFGIPLIQLVLNLSLWRFLGIRGISLQARRHWRRTCLSYGLSCARVEFGGEICCCEAALSDYLC